MTANHRQHTNYQNWIKRAIARSNESSQYSEPGKAEPVKVEPVTAEPVKVDQVKRERKPRAAKIAAVEPVTAPVVAPVVVAQPEPIKEPEPVKVELPVWKPVENEGIPAKTDRFQIITLENDIYNGKRIPFPSNTVYPVYFVGNQDGQLLQTVAMDDPDEKRLGWYYRTPASGSNPVEIALRDIKRLKTWQRNHYGKNADSENVIKLETARGNHNRFTVATAALLNAVRKLSNKAYIILAGYAFPAGTLAAILRLADDSTLDITIESEITKTVPNEGNNARGYHDKTAPGMLIKHGSTKTMLWGYPLNALPGKAQPELIPVTF